MCHVANTAGGTCGRPHLNRNPFPVGLSAGPDLE